MIERSQSAFLASIVAFVALFFAAASPESAAQTTPRQNPPSQASLDRQFTEQRISELQTATTPDEATRSALIETYRQVLVRLDSEEDSERRRTEYRATIENGPVFAAGLRDELARLEALPREDPPRPPDATSDSLQLQLTQVRLEIASLKAQLDGLDRAASEATELAARAPARTNEAREILTSIDNELAQSPEPGPDAVESERAARLLLLARKRARQAEIAMLAQALLSDPTRLEVHQAERAVVARRLADAERRGARVERWLSEVRLSEFGRARVDAERLESQAEARNDHALIKAATKYIADSAREAETKQLDIDSVRKQITAVEARATKLQLDYEQTVLSLELGITRAMGTVLLEQRRSLTDPASLRRAANRRSEEAAAVRLRLFGIERRLAETEGADAAERLLDNYQFAGSEPTGAERDRLRESLTALVPPMRDNLLRLQTTLRDYLAAVGKLETQERAFGARSSELAAILDERLIWIPNAVVLGPATLARLPGELRWLISGGLWQESWQVLIGDFERLYTLYGLVATIALALLLLRRRLRERLTVLATRVGNVRSDRIAWTIEALVIQVLNTSPLPGAVAVIGWRLWAAEEASEASKAIGEGLVEAAIVGFSFQLLRNLLRKQGIARAHFKWSERSARLVRSHLMWYAFIAVPLTFVVAVTQTQTDALVRHGLGRIAFVITMLAAVVLAVLLLGPKRGIFVGAEANRTSKWLKKSRGLWMPAGALLPLVLAILACAGYFYAALQLENRLNETLIVILVGAVLHALFLRWLMVSKRRLAMKVALERRAALAAKAEAGDSEDSIPAESMIEALEKIDVAQIEEQTQDLLRIAVAAVAGAAIWFAWVDVLPALGVLDDIPIPYSDITLANLGLALLVLAITITAASKGPGFLEIAVLQRLTVEPGIRYATRTLLLYAIVTIGVIIAFNAIGIGWSSVQWLIAALTVGLGFGLQEIFANFVSGIIILLERPVRVGDTVTVAGTSGVVTRIRMRATTIMDWNRRELLVPNKSFITGELINWSLSDPILRLDFVVGIAYGSDTTLAHQTMLATARKHPLVLEQPESNVFFVGFGDNSLNFEVRVFVNELTNTARSRIVHDLHMAIDRACRENHIEIAFPQRDLHFKSSNAVLRVALEGLPSDNTGSKAKDTDPA